MSDYFYPIPIYFESPSHNHGSNYNSCNCKSSGGGLIDLQFELDSYFKRDYLPSPLLLLFELGKETEFQNKPSNEFYTL